MWYIYVFKERKTLVIGVNRQHHKYPVKAEVNKQCVRLILNITRLSG